MQTIYIVRHGTTESVEILKIQGSSDSRLSPRGLAESQKTARALAQVKFDKVYCSPLGRAQETAAIICQSGPYPIEIVDDLREMNFGWYENKHDFTMDSRSRGIFRTLEFFLKFAFMQISGEPFAHARKRAIRAVEHIRRDCPQGTILIISHEILLHYVVNRLTGNTNLDAFADFRLEPCSISEFVLDDQGNAEIIRLNDTKHLAP